MARSIVRKALGLQAAALLCFCLGACGGAGKDQASSSALSSSGVKAPGLTPIQARARLYGDYDSDDYTNSPSGEGDNDEGTRPPDGDGDFDNSSNSYYDSDDDPIRHFGHAASAADARTIAELVKRYYAAAAAEDGAVACSMILSSVAKSLPGNLGIAQPPGPPAYPGKTCGLVLSKVFKLNHLHLAAYHAHIEVTGVRVEHDRALAVLGFKTLPGRDITLEREHGGWRLDRWFDIELP
jgi:hypothetical protein